MDLLGDISVFVRTIDTGSFTAAARTLGVTPSAVSRRIAHLESELGTRLIQRSTRSLRVTEDGVAFYERCTRLLNDFEAAKHSLVRARTAPRGILRVDVPVLLGRRIIAPAMPRFLARYPQLRVDLSLSDVFIDPVVAGVDLIVRIGSKPSSGLVGRRLGVAHSVICGAPSLLRERGHPTSIDDLARFPCVGNLRDGKPEPWPLRGPDGPCEVPISGPFHADDSDVQLDAAVRGVGLVRGLDILVSNELRAGTLEEVLPELRFLQRPIDALYPSGRSVSAKVRAYVDFLVELFHDVAVPVPRRSGDGEQSPRPRSR
ncbi:Transcriptional regulator, LysR family [Labilithrix luteola]|uniref:Transcriptional regulator, LysR family n=1 Tax=Labilithrix luteola TaxID=1391654 RepID=A0A0K1PZ35_9BACT|nr:LysR family transcriptional regulator [Labilithrix luteola]AKU98419.1 Transcriptional regulator, LysR family [Labilithrix luteola]